MSTSREGARATAHRPSLVEVTWFHWEIDEFIYQAEAFREAVEMARRWGWLVELEPVPTGEREGEKPERPESGAE